MSAELAQHIAHCAENGVRIHVWPCAAGFQANIAEQGTQAWTCHTDADPVRALLVALRQFVTRLPDRRVEVMDEVDAAVLSSTDDRTIDMEDYLAADDYEDLLG